LPGKTVNLGYSGNCSISWEDGDNQFISKKFVNTVFPYKLITPNNDFLTREVAVGELVSWTNLNAIIDGTNGLEKINGNNWGSANSEITFNPSAIFWIEHQLQFQSEAKAIGLSKNSSHIQNPTSIEAGFLIGKDYQIQLIFQGSVIRTVEAYSSDIIHLDYENGLIKWKLNGRLLEERSSNFSETIKILSLLKTGATIKTVYYSNNVELVTSSWQTTSGSINFDISSVPNLTGPYHYQINDTPIPSLLNQYRYLRDTIFSDSILIDSLTFKNTK